MRASSKMADFADVPDEAAIVGRARLRGKLAAHGRQASVELWLTQDGLFLVAAPGERNALAVDLLLPGAFSFELGKATDRLHVGGQAFATMPGAGRAVRELIALARLRAAGPLRSHAYPSKKTHLVRGLDALGCALLGRTLRDDEIAIALMPSSARADFESEVSERVPGRYYVLLSERRSLLVGLSELGDIHERELGELEQDHGRLLLGGKRSGFRQASLVVQELLDLSRLSAPERLTAAAQSELEHGHSTWARRLLALAADRTPRAAFALALATYDAAAPREVLDLQPALAALRREAAPADTLVQLCTDFGASDDAARLLLASLRGQGERAEPWALGLHRKLLGRRDRASSEALLGFAEHLLAAGCHEELLQLFARSLEPSSEEIDRALSEPSPRQRSLAMVRALDLAERAQLLEQRAVLEPTRSLARLEPFSIRRMLSLQAVAPASLAERVQEVRSLLQPGGLKINREPGALPERRQLPREALERRLPHPLGRRGALDTGALQGALSSSPEPDRETLRSWCERLSSQRHATALRAAELSATLLGLPKAELYVSRGERSLGVRAYAGKQPLLVIGALHLNEQSPQALDSRQLAFALAAELAHVRFGHSRATPRDVWRGALGKARVGVELALLALPLAKGLDLGMRAGKLLDKVPARALERALGLFADLEQSLDAGRSEAPELGSRHEELVTAHRFQELTADRAGLLACERLAPALTALFLLRSDYAALLPEVQELGLAAAAEGPLLEHPELLLRLASLVAFYLGPEFELLYAASRDSD